MFVLGIDPGLSRTGYAIVAAHAGGMDAVVAGVIHTDPARPLPDRLAELYGDLETVIAEHHPDEAAIESVFVNRNLQTATAVGRASGVSILAAARAGLPVHEYTPSAVKLAIAGYGDATKDQVEAMVARRLGLTEIPGPPDAADALAIAVCHLQGSSMRRAVREAGR